MARGGPWGIPTRQTQRRRPPPKPLAGMTTATGICTFMPQSVDRLILTQWLSPAFPVGSYAYSQGLEQAIADGAVTDAASLIDWIIAILKHGSARNDAILLAHARNEARPEDDLAELAYAYTASAERGTEMREQGAAFGQIIAGMTGTQPPPLPYALAVGHATRRLDLPTPEVLALFLHAFATQLTLVGVRFIPLGAPQGQQLLGQLVPLIATLGRQFATEPLSALSSATLGADIAAMRHETLEVRIYRS
jgi:urease accessory protein